MTISSRKSASLLLLAFFTYGKALAQTKVLALAENRLVTLYSILSSFVQKDYDSTSYYSDRFGTVFTNLIKNNPETINYPFRKLTAQNFCHIKTSIDGNFRVYSWNAQTGGTMQVFREIYQWKADGKVFTVVPTYEEGDPGRFCSQIFTISIEQKPYYLPVTNGIFSSKDAMQSISAYTIEGNRLSDTAKIFKTKTKNLNKIDVEFDFFSVVDRPERPLELITFDNKKKTIFIPVVDDKGQVTKKNILYQLKGHYLEFIGYSK